MPTADWPQRMAIGSIGYDTYMTYICMRYIFASCVRAGVGSDQVQGSRATEREGGK